MLSDTRPQAHQGAKVDDRREHHPFYGELLYTMQERLPAPAVPLHSLLLAYGIDIRVAPIGKGSLRTDKLSGAAGRITRGPHADNKEAPELLLTPGAEKGRPLQRPHARPNTDGLQGIQHRLTHRKKGRNGGELPSIKTIGIAGLGHELLGFLKIVG